MAFFTALRLVLPIYDERTLNRINILSLGTTVIILNGKLSVALNVSNHSALKSALKWFEQNTRIHTDRDNNISEGLRYHSLEINNFAMNSYRNHIQYASFDNFGAKILRFFTPQAQSVYTAI